MTQNLLKIITLIGRKTTVAQKKKKKNEPVNGLQRTKKSEGMSKRSCQGRPCHALETTGCSSWPTTFLSKYRINGHYFLKRITTITASIAVIPLVTLHFIINSTDLYFIFLHYKRLHKIFVPFCCPLIL